MDNIQDHLKDISEIRAMMERNSKFLSLSGLSGISAGICALVGAYIAHAFLDDFLQFRTAPPAVMRRELLTFFITDAVLVVLAAVGLALLFSWRMAKKKKLPFWTGTSKLLLLNLLIPLIAGGAFCMILVLQGAYAHVGAAMLLFYGLALLNASKFTLPEIRYLAITELVLGLACAIWYRHGFLFWSIGFGVAHIIYGAVMYFKYER